MYHIFFIHSSVDGNLGCFHVWVIVISTAMNIGVHVTFDLQFSKQDEKKTLRMGEDTCK